jgi:transposase, IS5 family
MTPLTFGRLPETHKLGEQLFAEVGRVLQASGVKLTSGTIVGATISGARAGRRMSRTRVTPRCTGPAKASNGTWEQRCISVWTVGALWRIARCPSQLTCMTGTRCRNCCTAKNGASTARAPMRTRIRSEHVVSLISARHAGGDIDEVQRGKNRNKSNIQARARLSSRS